MGRNVVRRERTKIFLPGQAARATSCGCAEKRQLNQRPATTWRNFHVKTLPFQRMKWPDVTTEQLKLSYRQKSNGEAFCFKLQDAQMGLRKVYGRGTLEMHNNGEHRHVSGTGHFWKGHTQRTWLCMNTSSPWGGLDWWSWGCTGPVWSHGNMHEK